MHECDSDWGKKTALAGVTMGRRGELGILEATQALGMLTHAEASAALSLRRCTGQPWLASWHLWEGGAAAWPQLAQLNPGCWKHVHVVAAAAALPQADVSAGLQAQHSHLLLP
jgi:hypothetical protein